jgi:hypothetical protein
VGLCHLSYYKFWVCAFNTFVEANSIEDEMAKGQEIGGNNSGAG